MRIAIISILAITITSTAAMAQTGEFLQMGSREAYNAIARARGNAYESLTSPLKCKAVELKDYMKKNELEPKGRPRNGVVLSLLPRWSPLCQQTVTWNTGALKLIKDRQWYDNINERDIITRIHRAKSKPTIIKDAMDFHVWESEAKDGDKLQVYRCVRGYGRPIWIRGTVVYKTPKDTNDG